MSLTNPSDIGLTASPAGLGAAHILLAEDPFINSFLRTVLGRFGYRITTADPAGASELLDSGEIEADLVITNSPWLFSRHASHLPLVFISATPDSEMIRDFPRSRALRKPFRNDELQHAVAALLRVVT